jgi:hypothetical protein
VFVVVVVADLLTRAGSRLSSFLSTAAHAVTRRPSSRGQRRRAAFGGTGASQ